MPRRGSATIVGTIAQAALAGPPAPPDWLEPAAAAIWRETVADLPAGHLRAADLQLLPDFCRTVDLARYLWTRFHALCKGADRENPVRVDDLLKEIRETDKSAAMLATKMRLVASANSRIETGSNRRMLPRTDKPWLR